MSIDISVVVCAQILVPSNMNIIIHILITAYVGKYQNIISNTNPVLGCKKFIDFEHHKTISQQTKISKRYSLTQMIRMIRSIQTTNFITHHYVTECKHEVHRERIFVKLCQQRNNN